jgi:hypothetical protein
MRCWKCEKEAIGICRFCGRGVCDDHFNSSLYIAAAYMDSQDDLNCIAVKGVLSCGKCQPIPKPVKISQLDIQRENKKQE